MIARKFHIGDVLYITTGIPLSRNHIAGVYEILDHMTGVPLMTHQLPRARETCRGPLLQQHPDLENIVVPKLSGQDEVNRYLLTLENAFGSPYRMIYPLPKGIYEQMDPITELKSMRPDAKILTVKCPHASIPHCPTCQEKAKNS